jgi:NADH-quinone oxidoreductase subunit L
VIHSLSGEQDLRNMGGLKKYTPITMVTLLCASLAIAGFPFLSGYYSKDLILEAAYEHAPWMYWIGVFTAGMTAFYVFRAFFMTFFGDYRGNLEAEAKKIHKPSHDKHDAHGHDDDHGHHAQWPPHESPPSMWIPLAILAVLSLIGGWAFNIPKFLEPLFPLHEGEAQPWLTYVSVAAGLGGIALAALFYLTPSTIPDTITSTFKGIYQLIYNKYFVDEAYEVTVIEPLLDGSRNLLWKVGDAGLIDGIVNGAGKTSAAVGGFLKGLQSGYIRNYAAWVLGGSILIIFWIGFQGVTR